MGKEFIAAQVQRADHNGVRFERPGNLPVGLVLFLLGGQRVTVDEQIFRAEQPDPVRAAALDAAGVIGLLDVGGEKDAMVVQRDGRLLHHVAEFFLERDLFADQLAILKQRLVGGIDDDDAIEAVQQGILTCFQFLAGILQANYGRNAQGAGHDGGVGSLAADVRGETEHILAVHLRGLRGRQIVRDDDARLFEMAQVQFFVAAQKMIEHTPRHVAHVADALAQVFVIHPGKRGRVAFRDGVKSVFGVDLLRLDHAHGFINERRVFKHQQVRVKNTGMFRPERAGELALDIEDLLARAQQRLFEPADFLRHLRVGQIAARYIVPDLVQNENLPAADARGNRDAPQNFLAFMQPLGHAAEISKPPGFEKEYLRGRGDFRPTRRRAAMSLPSVPALVRNIATPMGSPSFPATSSARRTPLRFPPPSCSCRCRAPVPGRHDGRCIRKCGRGPGHCWRQRDISAHPRSEPVKIPEARPSGFRESGLPPGR